MAEYQSMECKTLGGQSPQGRPRVFFCCAAVDFGRLFEPITKELLSIQPNIAIWYLDPQKGTMEGETFLADLSQMQLVVAPITTAFLRQDISDPARTVAFAYAIEHHIPVLPLLQEPELEIVFNEICGDIQFLDKNADEPTVLSYKEKLKRFLDSILVDDALAQRVRDAFDAYIFLSYRKKDRAAAQKIMRLIHKNEFCRDVAIWYDEFLTPGENFNLAIDSAIKKSSLFALVVTPHLLEDPNYVLTEEYPAACKMKKPILPLEAEQTDAGEIAKLYKSLQETTSIDNPEEINQRLQELLNSIAFNKNSDPTHTFLIGIAYLSGIDVEVDHTRAVNLITEAAEAGLPEAINKLVGMYENGEGVARDFTHAIDWQKALIERLRKLLKNGLSDSDLVTFWDACLSLGYLQQQCGFYEDAKVTYLELSDCIQKQGSHNSYVAKKMLLSCYRGLSITYDSLRDRYTARKWTSKAIDICEECLGQEEQTEFREKLAINYIQMGYLCGWTESPEELKGIVWYEKAAAILKELHAVNKSMKLLSRLGQCYIGIGQTYGRVANHSMEEKWKRKAVDLYESMETNENDLEYIDDLAFSYEQLGHSILGSDSEQNDIYLHALSLYLLESEKSESLSSLRGIVLCAERIASYYARLRDLENEERYIKKCLDASEKLVLLTQSSKNREKLADIYKKYGLYYKKKGQFAQEITWLTKSVEQLRMSVQMVESNRNKLRLYRGYRHLRDAYLEHGDYTEALTWSYEVNSIGEQLLEDNITNTSDSADNCRVYGHEIMADYEKSGDISRHLNQLSITENWYQKSYSVGMISFKRNNWSSTQKAIALLCKKLGNVIFDQGRPEDAIIWYEKSLEFDKEIVKKTGTYIERKNLAISYERLGMTCSELNRLPEALNWYQKFSEASEALAAEKDSPDILDFLCVGYYNLARRDWLHRSERINLLTCLLQISEELMQKSHKHRYQVFYNNAEELLKELNSVEK